MNTLQRIGTYTMLGLSCLGAGFGLGKITNSEASKPQIMIETDRSPEMYASKRAPTTITFNKEGATYTAILRNTDLEPETVEEIELSGRFGTSTIEASFQPEKTKPFEDLQNSLDEALNQMQLQ